MTTNNALEALDKIENFVFDRFQSDEDNDFVKYANPNAFETIRAALLDAPETVEGLTREADNAYEAVKTILENGLANETQKHNGLKYLNELRSYAQSRQSAGVPDGWKLVPIEPTRPMYDAGRFAIDTERKRIRDLKTTIKDQYGDTLSILAYRAMLEAAPQPPAGQEG